MTANVNLTPLAPDLWPLVADAERKAGINATLADGRKLLVTTDVLMQSLTLVVVSPPRPSGKPGRVVGAYAVTAFDLVHALALGAALYR